MKYHHNDTKMVAEEVARLSNDQIPEYCMREDVFKNFVTFYVHVEGSILSFDPTRVRTPNTINAIASINGLLFKTWIRNEITNRLALCNDVEPAVTPALMDVDILLEFTGVGNRIKATYSVLTKDPALLLAPVVTHETVRGYKESSGGSIMVGGLFSVFSSPEAKTDTKQDTKADGAETKKEASKQQSKPGFFDSPYVFGTMFRSSQEQANNAALINDLRGQGTILNPAGGVHDVSGFASTAEEAQVVGDKDRFGIGFVASEVLWDKLQAKPKVGVVPVKDAAKSDGVVGYAAGDEQKEDDEEDVEEKYKTPQHHEEYVTRKGKTTIYSPPGSTPDSLDYSPSFRSAVAKFYGSDLVGKAEAQGKNLSDMFATSYVGSPVVRERLVDLEVIRERKLEFRRECQQIYDQKREELAERGVGSSRQEFMLRHETRNLHRANQALAKVEQDIYDTIRTDGYKPNAAAKARIGLGRFGQTLEELGNNARYYGGEKLKIYSAGTYEGYRARMNQVEEFYRSTYVGQSTVANVFEQGAELAVSLPVFEIGLGAGLLWSAKAAGQVATRASYFGTTGVVNTASDWGFGLYGAYRATRALYVPMQLPTRVSALAGGHIEIITSQGRANIVQAEKMMRDLERRNCQAMFTNDGKLTQDAIQNSRKIMDVKFFNKKSPVYVELSKRGEISDWGKYTTDKFFTNRPGLYLSNSKHNLTADVHFYRNKVTGEVYYAKDFKVKFDNHGNQQMPVEEFINLLPKDWRPKL